MIRTIIGIGLILMGIPALPFMGAGLLLIVPGGFLLFSGVMRSSEKRSKKILSEAMIDANNKIKAKETDMAV